MTTSETPEQKCPKCGAVLNRATSINEEHTPEPGHLTICFNCIEICKFDMELKLMSLTRGELSEIKQNPELWNYIVEVQTAIVVGWNRRGLKGLN